MRLLLALGFACALGSACTPEVRGSPEPPADFGARETSLLGCPSMQGVYAWPPEAGAYAGGNIPSNRTPWGGGLPVRVHRGEMQIWIKPAHPGVVVRARTINRRSNVKDSSAQAWSLAEYPKLSCSSGMLEFKEVPIAYDKNFGCADTRRGFRLARLKDGALGVGIKTVAHDCTTSIFSWGGQSHGTYVGPDVVYWQWSKLRQTGDGENEPAPIDAYVDQPFSK